jgi:ABC-type dipeptide/oligopeptide/nickel transport system permease component/ABC-type dipeptide/oligopeptide/nickel transport system permease subunit
MATLHRHYGRQMLLGLLGLLLITFALPHLLPGPSLGRYAAGADTLLQRDHLGVEYDFGRPLPMQFVLWLRRLSRGQWGYSRFYQQPVFRETLRATSSTLLFLAWVGLACGLWLLLRRAGSSCRRHLGQQPTEKRRHIGAEVLPGFLVAIVLHETAIWQFGWVGWANVALFHPRYILNPLVMLLPAMALALLPLCVWSASRPSAATEQSPGTQFWSHWRQFQWAFGPLLGGFLLEVLLTEHIFTLSGLGRFGIAALRRRDVPALQGFMLGTGLLYLLLRLLCDLRSKRPQDTPTVPDHHLGNLQRSRYALYRGTLGLLVVLALAAWAPRLWPYDPTEIHAHDQLLLPNSRYIFGTDFLGRDVLSRTIEGFRSTIPRLIVITGVATGLGVLLAGLRRLLPGLGALLWHCGRGLTAALPPFLLAFIVFLVVEQRPWALETALTVACLPIAAQATAGNQTFRHRVAMLAQVGESILMLEVIFFYLNLRPELLTPNWGSDLRVGMHYSNINMWLLLAPGSAVVWIRYILRQFQVYGRLTAEAPDLLSSAIPTEALARLRT